MSHLLLVVAVTGAMALQQPYATAVVDGCAPSPARAPWVGVASPVTATSVPFLSAHRGGTNLAPQQTAEAYKSALAFGATVIEVDLHVLADGALAVFHDDTAPDGRPMSEVTSDEFLSWTAAKGGWAETEFRDARYMLFDDVLEIAAHADAGLDVEFKDLDPRANAGVVPPYEAVATKVRDARLMGKTIWQHHDAQQLLVATVRAVDPNARFNYNILGYESPAQLYAKASEQDFSFGSSLDKFTPEVVAAIHDGCGIAVPHSYDAGAAAEGDQIRAGRAAGIDGFQTNQVDVAVAALGLRAPAMWRRDSPSARVACLVNPHNGYGLIGRSVVRSDGVSMFTGKGGCVDAGPRKMAFTGDGAALSATENRHS